MKRTLISETIKKAGDKVKVIGWADTVRSHGKLVFVDLRDSSGVLQLFFDPKNEDLLTQAKNIKAEWVLEQERLN